MCLTSHQQLRSYGEGHGLESHLTDLRSGGSNSGPLGTRREVYPLHHSSSLVRYTIASWLRKLSMSNIVNKQIYNIIEDKKSQAWVKVQYFKNPEL